MKINELDIISYKGLLNTNIKFTEPSQSYFSNLNISVIVGENGTGKTRILRLLTDAFCPNRKTKSLSQLEEPSVTKEFNLTYYMNGKTVQLNERDSYLINSPKKVIVSSFAAFDPFSNNRELLSKDTSNNMIIDRNEGGVDYIYCGPQDGNYSSFKPVVSIITDILLKSPVNKEKVHQYEKLLNRIGYNKTLYVLIDRLLIYQNKSKAMKKGGESEEFYQSYEKELRLLISDNKVKRMPNSSLLSVPINLAKVLYYKYTESLEVDLGIRDIIYTKGEAEVQLSQMSSGEITMLFRFLPLIITMEHNSLILIDEPETHLHPTWAKHFVDYLTSLFSEYHSHIIIASHSPTIVSELPMQCIVGLKRNGSDIKQYFPKDRTLGAYPNEILMDVFELKKLNGEFYKKTVQHIVELFESGEIGNIKKATDLYDDLSTTSEKFELFKKYRRFLEE